MAKRFSFMQTLKTGADSLPFYGTGGVGPFPWRFLLPGTKIDFEEEARFVYDNSVVSACIGWLSRTFPEAPLVVQKPIEEGDSSARWETVPNELTKLIEHPNQWYDDTVLWSGTILSLISSGNAYWFIDSFARNGKPTSFVYIPHHQCWPAADHDNQDGRKLVTHYEYYPSNGGGMTPIPVERIVHFRTGIDPRNPNRGLSPMAAALREVVTENEAATYSAALLKNMGVPGAVLVTKENHAEVTPTQLQNITSGWNDITGDGAGRLAVIPIPGELTSITMTPEQLALTSLRNVPVGRICAACGLDPMVLGLPSENKTYANYDIAKKSAYESALIPVKNSIASQLTTFVLPRFGGSANERVSWDYSKVTVLQPDQDKLFQRWTQAYFGGAVKRSHVLNAFGLPWDRSDEIYIHDAILGVDEETKALRKAIGAAVRENRARVEAIQLGELDEFDPENPYGDDDD